MNEQMDFLARMIEMAKEGPDGEDAIPVLRDICRMAADEAPPNDLIRMAQFLYGIRAEAAQRDAERN
jgi:hypothetical protein